MRNKIFLIIFAVIIISGLLFFINGIDDEKPNENHYDLGKNNSEAKFQNNDEQNNTNPNDESKRQIINNNEGLSKKESNPEEKSTEGVVLESGGLKSSSNKNNLKEEIKDAGDKYPLEIILIDNETNKPILNYDLEAKLGYSKLIENNYQNFGVLKKYKSDSNGRIFLATSNLGHNQLSVITKDYAFFSGDVNIRNKNNQMSIRLIKGGTIIITAVNELNKNVEGLKITLFSRNYSLEIEPLIRFDALKGVYILCNMPIDIMDIYFKAEGYQSTKKYQITVEPLQTVNLHVQLIPIKAIQFEIENKVKPDFIKIIVKYNYDLHRFQFNPNKETTIKLKNNVYEYLIEESFVDTVILFAENYVPLQIKLLPNQSVYKVKLEEGLKFDIFVNEDNGKPMKNLKIMYTVNYFNGEVFTNEKGQATLSCLSNQEKVSIWIYLKGFKSVEDSWVFNSQTDKSKIYTLVPTSGISGKVTFGDLPIKEAKVFFHTKQGMMSMSTSFLTDNNGNYLVDVRTDNHEACSLKAFHSDYGASITHDIKWEGKPLVVDINLIQEKNKTIVKLVDEYNVPIPNTKIFVECNEYYLREIASRVITTDERGECELQNIIPSGYYFQLHEGKYYFKDYGEQQLPKDEIVLIAKNKDLRKISVFEPSNVLYKGYLFCSVGKNNDSIPCDIFYGAEGLRYLDIRELNKYNTSVPFSIIFETPGYGSVILGPYEKEEDVPLEFNINLPIKNEIKFKVVGSNDNLPIPYAMISLNNIGSTAIKKIQTNEVGEISVNFLNGKFKVESSVEGFAQYRNEFDTNSGKEFLIKISKGGSLRVHLSLSDSESASISLAPSDKNAQLDSKGNAEIINLMAGEYSLSIDKSYGKNSTYIDIPKPVHIEEDKTLELNLDDLIKKLTSLEIIMLKDGVRSNEPGMLSVEQGYISIGENSKIENGSQLFDSIVPGRRLVCYQYLQNSLYMNVDVLLNQKNVLELNLPSAKLSVIVKNEEGAVLSNVFVKLNFGDKYRTDEQIGMNLIENGLANFNLFPNFPHCLMLECDSTSNYEMKVVTPINLNIGQEQKLEITMSKGRKLPNLQLVDANGKPLDKVSFGITDEKGNFMRRTHREDLKFYPFSDDKGFLPANGWPNGKFTLIVSKNGYGYQEIDIPAEFDTEHIVQIKLQKGSSIKCVFPRPLDYPITVGILRSNGELLRKPIDFRAHTSSTFYPDITKGNVTIQDLKAGTYYIGYFWNYAPTKLIAKQGPFQLSEGQNIEVISNLVFE